MEDFRFKNEEEECMNLINDKARLDVEVTGEHYLLSSGLHTGVFFPLAKVFEYGPVRERLGRLLLRKMKAGGIDPREIDVLLGPAYGALPVMYTLQHFSDLEHTRVIHVEKDNDGEYVLGRCYTLHPDERVFVIDDVVTTFGTVKKTITALHRACGKEDGWDAKIIGIGVLLDRTAENRQPPEIFAPTLKYVYALRSPLEAYKPKECSYCKQGIKLVKI